MRAPRSWLAAGGLVLLVALALCTHGLEWGLPSPDHYASYHGGESRAVGVALQMDATRGELEPRWRGEPFFKWGSHALYAFHAAFLPAGWSGALELGREPHEWTRSAFATAHRLARWVSVAYTVGTVALVLVLGTAWFGRRAGALAGLWTASAALLPYEAHFATSNPCLTFWCVAAVGLCVRAGRTPRPGAFVLAGAACGLAVGAKLSALALGLPALAAVVAAARAGGRDGALGRGARLALAGTAGAVVGFAAVTPYALVHPGAFREQAVAEVLEHSSEGHGLVFEGTGNGWLHLLLVNLPTGLGWPLWALSVAALALSTARVARRGGTRGERWPELACLLWIAGNVAVLGRAEVRYLRYLMPVVPFLALLAGAWSDRALSRASRVPRAVLAIALALASVATLVYAAASVDPFARPDPKDRVLAWFDENVPPGTRVGLLKRPSHLTAPIYPDAADPFGGGEALGARVRPGWDVVLVEDADDLARLAPELVVVNELEVRAERRLGPDPGLALDPRWLARLRGTLAALEALERDYELAAPPFESRYRLGPLDLSDPDPPRGWDAATQEIRVHRRRAPGAGSRAR